MIQSIMLVSLGVLIAGFVTLLFASAFWRRAIRLTTERIHNSMPVTLAEIEADKDQLRADFAIQIRQLEEKLEKAETEAAKQTIEISRKEVKVVELKTQLEERLRDLEEQQNANEIFEQTITNRLPKMEAQLAKAKELLGERYMEISKLRIKINQQEGKIGEVVAKDQIRKAELQRLKQELDGNTAPANSNGKDVVPLSEFELLKEQNESLETRISKLREEMNEQTSSPFSTDLGKEDHIEDIELSLLGHSAKGKPPSNGKSEKSEDEGDVKTILLERSKKNGKNSEKISETVKAKTKEVKKTKPATKNDEKSEQPVEAAKSAKKSGSLRKTLSDRLKNLQDG
ncbi:MAG: hypothetical protein ACR2OW_07190 [Methyloligellaceae bacterium]